MARFYFFDDPGLGTMGWRDLVEDADDYGCKCTDKARRR
jgi:hypothetical protein